MGASIGFPNLHELIRSFLFEQLNPEDPRDIYDVPLDDCPKFIGRVSVFNSAVATFWAPSDELSGTTGMTRERIRAIPSWRKGAPRYDCAFVKRKGGFGSRGMRSLDIVRVRLFFSFVHDRIKYSCALVEWFDTVGDSPHSDTGMWVVEPTYGYEGQRLVSVIRVDSMVRNAHLMPVYGKEFLPKKFRFFYSLDAFKSFFVNKYIDHQATQLAY